MSSRHSANARVNMNSNDMSLPNSAVLLMSSNGSFRSFELTEVQQSSNAIKQLSNV